MKADGGLLFAGEAVGIVNAADATRYFAAVIAPGKVDPGAVLLVLVAKIGGLLEGLVVIDAKNSGIERGVEEESADLRAEEAGTGVAEDHVGAEALGLREADFGGKSVDFRFAPFDREGNGGVEQGVEIEGVVGELPDVTDVDQNALGDGLLEAGVVLIAAAWLERRGAVGSKGVAGKPATAGTAGENQSFVIRSLEETRVREAKDSAGGFDLVRRADAGLNAELRDQPVIKIGAQTGLNSKVLKIDRIFDVEGFFLDVGVSAEVELTARAEELDLRIGDDGVGFDPELVNAQGGLGLVSMRERLGLVAGKITFDSAPSAGTRIKVRVPLPTASEIGTALKEESATEDESALVYTL